MRTAVDNWADLDGYAAAHGMPPLTEIPLARFCNFVWYMLAKGAKDEVDLARIRAKLWQPPKGEAVTDPRSPWSPQAEMGALAALKAGLGGAPKAVEPRKSMREEYSAARAVKPPA